MLELDNFLRQYRIDICLLTKTHLRIGEAFWMANYVGHRTDWLKEGGGTAILVCRGIDHYAVHVQGQKHLEATAIQVTLASKPVKILAVYLRPSWPDCFGCVCLPWRRSYCPHGG
jgi:hypothetical protein